MPERQDPRPDPIDQPSAPYDHVRGEDVYPGATAEPTMGWSVSPESRVHHTDEDGPTRAHPALWAALVFVALVVLVALAVLVL
jgi:hypothetical protein